LVIQSKKLHSEIERREAHVLTANFEAFVDDVISGKIERKIYLFLGKRYVKLNWIDLEEDKFS
jgi:hypothetical protein